MDGVKNTEQEQREHVDIKNVNVCRIVKKKVVVWIEEENNNN